MMKSPSDALVRLRELTPSLPVPSFQDITLDTNSSYVELDMINGIGFGFNLLYLPGVISVARWFSDAGAIFPTHSHPELEVITVYSGDMTIQLYNSAGEQIREECLFPGVTFYLEPNTSHGAYFTSDTWYIALTVPANEGWPHE